MKTQPWRQAIVVLILLLGAAAMVAAIAYAANQPDSGGWLPITLSCVGIGLLVWGGYRRSKVARRRNSALAARLGWRVGSASYSAGLQSDPFETSGTARADGSLHGKWRGHPAESIYYQGEFEDEEVMKSTHRVELVVVDALLPTLAIAPRRWWRRLDRSHDLDVESAEFNRRFLVSTTDMVFAHAILHPRMIERLLQPDARGLDITFERHVIMTSKRSKSLTARGIEQRVAVLADLADLIPAHVKSQFGSERAVAQREESAEPGARKRRVGRRTKGRNWIAWLGLVFVWTVVGAPIGIALAQWSLRAYRLGQSTNGAFARKVRFWGAMVMLAIAIFLVMAAVTLLLQWLGIIDK